MTWAQMDTMELNPKSIIYRDTIPLSEKIFNYEKSGIYTLDSVFFYDWISGTGQWIEQQSNLYYYDHQLNDTLQMIRLWNASNNQWLSHLQYKRHFNVMNMLEEQIQSQWNVTGARWINYSRTRYEYDRDKRLDFYLVQSWNAANSMWENRLKYSYEFDNEGNWIFYLKQTWDPDSSKWLFNYQFLYTYTSGLKTTMIRQDWDSEQNIWINRHQTNYQYDPDHRLSEEFGEVWDHDSAVWDPNSLITYIRDPGGAITEKIYQAWAPSGWFYTVKYGYVYNDLGWNTRITYYTSEGGVAEWSNHSQYNYDYNAHGELIRELWNIWNATQGLWNPDFKIDYWGSQVDVNVLNASKTPQVTISPNPASRSIQIVFDDPDFHDVMVTIMDGLGRPVLSTRVHQNPARITDLGLASGLYFICIERGGHRLIKKLIIQH